MLLELNNNEPVVLLRLLETVAAKATPEEKGRESFQTLERIADRIRGLSIDPAFGYEDDAP